MGVASQRKRKPRCTPSFLSGVSEFFLSKHDSGKCSVVSPELWECPRIVSGVGGGVSPRNVSGGSRVSVSHRLLLGALETFSLTAKGSSAIKSEPPAMAGALLGWP